MHRLFPFARRAGRRPSDLTQRKNGRARSELLPADSFVLGQKKDRKPVRLHQIYDILKATPRDPRRIAGRNQVCFGYIYFDRLPHEFEHSNHLVTIACSGSIQPGLTPGSILGPEKQKRRECVTTRADVQSGVSAMNNPKHNRKHPRPPGLIRAGGLIHDPRRPPGQRPAAQGQT